MLGTLAYITLVDHCLLTPVSGSGVGTNRALMDTTGAPPYVFTGKATSAHKQKQDKREVQDQLLKSSVSFCDSCAIYGAMF